MQHAHRPPADGVPARSSHRPTDHVRASVLGYARLCCPDEATARRLVDEAARGLPPTGTARPPLVAAVRHTAARWADTGRSADLADGFRAWLHAVAARHPGPGLAHALAAAEQDAALLQAFRRLPGHRQEELWQGLGPDGDLHPPAPPVRAALFDTYLQVYAAGVPARACRQLVARLGDTVRRGTATEDGLADHLDRCGQCRTARTELGAVRDWHRPVLLPALLLWTGGAPVSLPPGPVPPPSAAAPTGPAPRRTVAAGAVALIIFLALAAAVAARPGHPPAPAAAVPVSTTGEPAPTPPSPSASAPPSPAPTTVRPVAPPPTSPAPMPTPTPSPSPSRTTPPPVPTPTPVVTVTVTLDEP